MLHYIQPSAASLSFPLTNVQQVSKQAACAFLVTFTTQARQAGSWIACAGLDTIRNLSIYFGQFSTKFSRALNLVLPRPNSSSESIFISFGGPYYNANWMCSGWPPASISQSGPADGFRRCSKHLRTSPQRYTPPATTTRKKNVTKKVCRRVDISGIPADRDNKDTNGDAVSAGAADAPAEMGGGKSVSHPKPPSSADLVGLIAGFAPFVPPTPTTRASFLEEMEEAKCQPSASESNFPIVALLDVFQCTTVPTAQVVDRVISSIHTRRDSLTDARFDFLPESFFPELLRHFPGFEATTTKADFSFSPALRGQFMYRPQWFTKVDYLYSPVLIRDTHWVGVIVDLKMWVIYVVDSNPACPSEFAVNSVLTPISILLPHLISRYCLTTRAEELDYLPLPILRLDIPLLVEHPEYSAVVALVLFV
ncbi:hypothetical protein N665_0184s0007 [Sinapis alba]|nr:hypothetical protein N665_0184s0007 [Sinapis alba]